MLRSSGSPEIADYKNDPADYIKTENGVGVCEIRGAREEQEDRLVVAAREQISTLPQLNDQQINASFNNTFAAINSKVKDMGDASKKCGSTCICMTAWQDPRTNQVTVCTANLGDSEGILVIIRKNGTVEQQRLNTLHNPGDEAERRRTGKFIRKGRLGGLAVTRAFGDHSLDAFNISHEPEVNIKRDITVSDGDRVFIVTGCDGMTDGVTGDDKQKLNAPSVIADIVSDNKKNSTDLIAQALVSSAFQRSTDNITASVFEAGETPTSVLVCDGHGGDAVAEQISRIFYSTLQNKINDTLSITAETKPDTSARLSTTEQQNQESMEMLLRMTGGGTLAGKSNQEREFLTGLLKQLGPETFIGPEANANLIRKVLDIRKDKVFLLLLDSNFEYASNFMKSMRKLTKEVIFPDMIVRFEDSATLGKYFLDAPRQDSAAKDGQQISATGSNRKLTQSDVADKVAVLNNIVDMLNQYITTNPDVIISNEKQRLDVVLDIASLIYTCSAQTSVEYDGVIKRAQTLPKLNDLSLRLPDPEAVDRKFPNTMESIKKIIDDSGSETLKRTIGRVVRDEIRKTPAETPTNKVQASSQIQAGFWRRKYDDEPAMDAENAGVKPDKRLK